MTAVVQEFKNKRIIPVFLDMGVATENKIELKNLVGFEPTEIRLLQYGAINSEAAAASGILICDELKDFNLIICCAANSSISNQAKMSCPSSGALSSLNFTLTVSGGGARQVTQDLQVFLVLEFLRK